MFVSRSQMFFFFCCSGRCFCVLFSFSPNPISALIYFNLQDMLLLLAVSCSSVNEIPGETSECMENGRIDANLTAPTNYSSLTEPAYRSNNPTEHGLTRTNKIAFSSLPPLHISEQAKFSESQNLINQHLHSSNAGGRIIKSCPQEIASGRVPGISANQNSLPAHVTENNSQRKYFTSHWSMDDVNEGLQVSVTF